MPSSTSVPAPEPHVQAGSEPLPTGEPLSLRLKEHTATAHENTETSAFMSQLLSGKLSKEAVAIYTAQLWHVYSALEPAIRAARHTPEIAAVYDANLERTEQLEQDLYYFYGAQWKDEVEPLAATKDYVARIHKLASSADNPGAAASPELLAHHYVRYMGDIAGGQVIARRVADFYGVAAEGLNFYDFSAIGKIPPYRERYRAGVDGLECGVDKEKRLLDEAVEVFAYNSAMFEGLDSMLTRQPL